MRLLLAEDEKALSKALTAILERNNYFMDVLTAYFINKEIK